MTGPLPEPRPAPAPATASALPDELSAWLRLLASPGIGRESARRLLAALGSPQAVFDADPAALRSVVGAAASGLLRPPDGHARQVADTLAWLAGGADRRILVLGDADYPQPLLHSADPPLLLYLWGELRRLCAPSLAVVGSRKPTPQGREHAHRFSAQLAGQGWTVVSGLAAGIDAAAHLGALDGGPDGGSTVAVMGTGIDRVYPAGHADLAHRIVAEGGLLVSELPLGSPPLAAHFPQRNRIIAGLSRGTLVVEAALRSGSLITARLAAEAGREVLVLPGSILSEQAAGCHHLIRQGATLVVSVEQILDELDRPALQAHAPAVSASPEWPTRSAPTESGGSAACAGRTGVSLPGLDTANDAVLEAMGYEPVSLDALLARCGWPAPALNAHLLTLELEGAVARLPGGLFQRIGAG